MPRDKDKDNDSRGRRDRPSGGKGRSGAARGPEKKFAKRGFGGKSEGGKPDGERRPYAGKRDGDAPRPRSDRPFGDRPPRFNRDDRPRGEKSFGDRPSRGGDEKRPFKPRGDRPNYRDDRGGDKRPYTPRGDRDNSDPVAPVRPRVSPTGNSATRSPIRRATAMARSGPTRRAARAFAGMATGRKAIVRTGRDRRVTAIVRRVATGRSENSTASGSFRVAHRTGARARISAIVRRAVNPSRGRSAKVAIAPIARRGRVSTSRASTARATIVAATSARDFRARRIACRRPPERSSPQATGRSASGRSSIAATVRSLTARGGIVTAAANANSIVRAGAPRRPHRLAGASAQRAGADRSDRGDRFADRPRRENEDDSKVFAKRPAFGGRGAYRERKPDFDRRPPREEPKPKKAGERIAKVLARAGLASRRDAEEMVTSGRVSVNGRVINSPALDITANDVVAVDGKQLPPRERTRLFMYHKPRGLMTTHADPEGRPTVFDNLPEGLPRLISIGRLDFNTEGLLLLTNDGGLARTLELPDTGWLRRYRVRAHGEVTQAQLDQLKEGVEVDGVKYGSIDATLERDQGANVWLVFAIREGKNREVRNVMAHLGLEVNRLIRVSYGPFQLGEIAEGQVEEIKTRVLREQLGEKIAKLAGVDFSRAEQGDDRREAMRRRAARSRSSQKARAR